MAKQIIFYLTIDYQIFTINLYLILVFIEKVLNCTKSAFYIFFYINRQVNLAMKDDEAPTIFHLPIPLFLVLALSSLIVSRYACSTGDSSRT